MQCKDIPLIDILSAIEAMNIESSEWFTGKREECYANIPERMSQYPYKVVMAKLLKLDNAGYIEWGTSMRVPWLTDEGKAKLEGLKRERCVA